MTSLGGHLVLTSCSAELGIELRSAYLGGERSEEILVAESAIFGAGPAELSTRHLADPAEGEAHTYERRRLIYDHLQRLQGLAAQGGLQFAFDGVADAAVQFDPLAPPIC